MLSLLWKGFYVPAVLLLVKLSSVTTHALVIRDRVSEVSFLINTNSTLHCDITSEGTENQLVLWKKIFNDDHDKVLIVNNHTTEADKYGFADGNNHGIVVYHVAVEDEALYQCEIGDVAARTVVSVLVPVDNLTLSTDGDVLGTGPFNLTCRAQHARPPASIKWFRGIHDVTPRATSFTSNLHPDGYGDSSSMLHVPIEWSGRDVVFRCVAYVGDVYTGDTAFVFLPQIGSVAALLSHVWSVILASSTASLLLPYIA